MQRRYDPQSDPQKVYGDLLVLLNGSFRGHKFFPTWDEVFQRGYHKLALAMRELDYHACARACEMEPDPHYWLDRDNLRTEIERHFIDPQWKGLSDDQSRDFEPALPRYAELSSHAEISKGLAYIGGISKVFGRRGWGLQVDTRYYLDDDNLRAELEILMPKLRTKALPTYVQLEDHNKLLIHAYLVKGGYSKTAQGLGLPESKGFLKVARNLYWELTLVDVDEARRDGEPIDEGDLSSISLHFMPTEEQLRAIRRADLHSAVVDRGGYYATAQTIECFVYANFWRDNPSLPLEMRRVASSLKRPRVLPSKDELVEIGRKDLVNAINQNGGVRKVAKLCGLEIPRAVRRSEAPLRMIGNRAAFIPYPMRRFEQSLDMVRPDCIVRFEVATTSKRGKGRVEEYGAWLFRSQDQEATLGRVGWVRRRPGRSDLWLYRLEGEGRWRGAFGELSLSDAVGQLLQKSIES